MAPATMLEMDRHIAFAEQNCPTRSFGNSRMIKIGSRILATVIAG